MFVTERRPVHIHPPSARGRPAEWRAALREVEPDAECQVSLFLCLSLATLTSTAAVDVRP